MIRAEILRKKKQESLHKVRLFKVKLGWGVYTYGATTRAFVRQSFRKMHGDHGKCSHNKLVR